MEVLSSESVRATQHHQYSSNPTSDRRDLLLILNHPRLILSLYDYFDCLDQQRVKVYTQYVLVSRSSKPSESEENSLEPDIFSQVNNWSAAKSSRSRERGKVPRTGEKPARVKQSWKFETSSQNNEPIGFDLVEETRFFPLRDGSVDTSAI